MKMFPNYISYWLTECSEEKCNIMSIKILSDIEFMFFDSLHQSKLSGLPNKSDWFFEMIFRICMSRMSFILLNILC